MPGCLPNNNAIESYHNSLMRLKLLLYRAHLESFLGSGLPRTLHLASLDLCSPIQRGLPLWSATSLQTGLALLQLKDDDHCAVYCMYPGHPNPGGQFESAEEANEDGAWSVCLVNGTGHADNSMTKTRVGFAAFPAASCPPLCACRPTGTWTPWRAGCQPTPPSTALKKSKACTASKCFALTRI